MFEKGKVAEMFRESLASVLARSVENARNEQAREDMTQAVRAILRNMESNSGRAIINTTYTSPQNRPAARQPHSQETTVTPPEPPPDNPFTAADLPPVRRFRR